ncbi:MAG: sigma-70 family RNA polymerase sigma factor [Flavobacteriales bacterium]|nr:sigma-70 family RNA polymerase sigma factor [Flavobacteriales bacterium]
MQGKSIYHQSQKQLLSENDIVEAAKKDPKQFEALYKKYYEQIFRYIHQRMDDKEMAFDITSQVFLKAMINLPKYKYKGVPFSSWLYRIAMSEVYQSFKDKKSTRTVNVDTSNVEDIIDEVEQDNTGEMRQALIEVIGDLPEIELQIIEMRYFEKRSYREIGDILGMTENNAKVRAYRIVEKLKKRFSMRKSYNYEKEN